LYFLDNVSLLPYKIKTLFLPPKVAVLEAETSEAFYACKAFKLDKVIKIFKVIKSL